MPLNMDPWFDEAMDILSSRVTSTRRGSLAFTRAASVFDSELSRIRHERKPAAPKTNAKSSEPGFGESKMAEFEEMKKRLRTCQDEIYKLKAANSDLNMVNKRWHTYNTDMQSFVDKLQHTIRDQQEQINNIGSSIFASCPTRSEETTECDRPECRLLREEVAKLREEKSHLLLQVKAHKEDWEAEKNEKQEALKDRDAVKQRLDSVLRDMCLSSTQTVERRSTRCGCCNVDWEELVDPERAHASNYSGTFRSDSARFSVDSLDRDGGYLRPLNIVNSESEINERGLEDSACALRPKEESYSMVSTVPLSTPPEGLSPCSSNASLPESRTFSMGIKSDGAMLTSYVQLPVVKSSSAPERRSAAFRKPPKFVNSISLSVLPPQPARKPHGAFHGTFHGPRNIPYESANTQTDDDVVCPVCRLVFTPDVQMSFGEHFESCKERNDELTS